MIVVGGLDGRIVCGLFVVLALGILLLVIISRHDRRR